MTSTNTSPELPAAPPPMEPPVGLSAEFPVESSVEESSISQVDTTSAMSAFRTVVEKPMEKAALVFEEVALPSRYLKEQNWNMYRVYKDSKEFVTVEGEAAYDAIAKSGVERPFRVVRAMKELGDVLTAANLLEQTEGAEKSATEKIPESGIIEPPSAVAAPDAAPDTAPPASVSEDVATPGA